MRPRQKSCMKTSALARLRRPPTTQAVRTGRQVSIRAPRAAADCRLRSPSPRRRGRAIAALELGAGEQFGELRIVSGGRAGSAGSACSRWPRAGPAAVALAGPAGDLQGGIVDPLDEAEAGAGCRPAASAGRSSATRAELALDHAGRLQLASRRASASARPGRRRAPRPSRFAAGAVDFEFGGRPVARHPASAGCPCGRPRDGEGLRKSLISRPADRAG